MSHKSVSSLRAFVAWKVFNFFFSSCLKPFSCHDCVKIICLTSAAIQICCRFKGAQPDHMRVQSTSCCFARELVSFIRPRELESFNPRHVTRSPPIRKRIGIGRCNKSHYTMPNKYGKCTRDFGAFLFLF